jgi:acetolactate synthase I/II/III large subunit
MQRFAGRLRTLLPKDAIWVRDVTQSNTTWGDRVVPLHDPHQNVCPVGAGIGQGLSPAAGAAAAANGRKTIVMTDDGFFLDVGELGTAVQEWLDLAIVVMNDRGRGVIRRIRDATQGSRRFLAGPQSPGLRGLAQLAGVPSWKVERAEVFGETIGEALRCKGPGLVEVDLQQVGEFPACYAFNQRR